MPDSSGRTKRVLVLVNACVLTFMATLDGSIVNIALPTVAKSLGVGIGSVQWVVTSYLIAISALLLVWGRLSDMYGRRRFFAAGLALFTLGSLLCGLSTSLVTLVFSRILQAVGASMAMALVQGIVTATFPPEERGKALGFVGAVVSIGSLVGPSAGGLLVATAGWRSIFFVNVPVGILGVILTFLVMPESKAGPGSDGKLPTFDTAGAVLLVLAISTFFGTLLAFQEGLVTALPALALLALALAFFVVFLKAERGREPLVDSSLFRNPVFRIGVFASCLSFVAMFCYTFFMPFYLQVSRGMAVLEAGAIMSLYPLVTAVLAPLSGALSDRYDYRVFTVSGLLLNATGLALLATLGADSSLFAVGAIIVLLGIGGACFQSPNNSSVMGSVPHGRLGIAGGLNSFFRNLGMVTGTALAVTVFSLATKAGVGQVAAGAMDAGLFLRGFRIVVLVASCVALAGAVLEIFGRSSRRLGTASRSPKR